MKQQYHKYTQEDHKVWSILFSRQIEALKQNATVEFLKGLEKVNFIPEYIPDFKEVNERLMNLTGWQLEAVPGIMPDKEFFELLYKKQFPATTWIRKMEQLDYLEEPDMFHDVFGHVPILSNGDFCNFLQGLSKIALKNIGDAHKIYLLSRIYWYTVEFGLIEEEGKLKIYGAGILSSIGESKYSLSDQPQRLLFNVADILNADYRKDKFQEKYFVINSYKELYESLPEIEKELEKIGVALEG